MTAKILCLDIERQSALVEGVWDLGEKVYIHPSRVVEPSRTICFAYQWISGFKDDRIHFVAEWDTGEPQDNRSITPGGGHRKMTETASELLTQADFVVGWNSKAFDVPHLRGHIFAYDGIAQPAPHQDIDLMLQVKGAGKFMSYRLGVIAEQLGLEGKEKTGGQDLWHTLRWADGDVLKRAQRKMKKYNMRDVELTTEMFELSRPWLRGVNFPLYEDPDSEDFSEPRCTNCSSFNLQKRGPARNRTRAYQRYCCNDCGHWSQGRLSMYTTETRGI